MDENHWIISVEKTFDNRYVVSFAGKLQLRVTTVIGVLVVFGSMMGAVRSYF